MTPHGYKSQNDAIVKMLSSGKYRVDDDGILWRTKRNGSECKCGTRTMYGYLVVHPFSGKTVFVHRVVYFAKIGPIPTSMEINHKNGVKTDNRIENLEIVPPSENMNHAIRMGFKRRRVDRTLTPSIAEHVRKRVASGERQIDIAHEMGVNKNTIWEAVHYRSWPVEVTPR